MSLRQCRSATAAQVVRFVAGSARYRNLSRAQGTLVTTAPAATRRLAARRASCHQCPLRAWRINKNSTLSYYLVLSLSFCAARARDIGDRSRHQSRPRVAASEGGALPCGGVPVEGGVDGGTGWFGSQTISSSRYYGGVPPSPARGGGLRASARYRQGQRPTRVLVIKLHNVNGIGN